MSVIVFPNFAETFMRVMHEVVGGFFDGSNHNFGDQTDVAFPQCDVVFNRRRIDRTLETPMIIFAGDKVLRHADQKCEDPNGVRPFAYEAWAAIERSVFVRTKLYSGNSEQSFREAIRIYDLLFAVIATEHSAFASRGIKNPTLTAMPAEDPDKENCVVSGVFNCIATATYVRTA